MSSALATVWKKGKMVVLEASRQRAWKKMTLSMRRQLSSSATMSSCKTRPWLQLSALVARCLLVVALRMTWRAVVSRTSSHLRCCAPQKTPKGRARKRHSLNYPIASLRGLSPGPQMTIIHKAMWRMGMTRRLNLHFCPKMVAKSMIKVKWRAFSSWGPVWR